MTPSNKGGQGTSAKYSSILPEIFAGNPNRIQRYYQFDDMARDSDVSAALDTIADFCTQSEEQSDTPFLIVHKRDADESAVKLLDDLLYNWVKINKFKKRLWKIFRDTIKYGDTFFAEDPETGIWYWVDQYSVELVKVSSDGFKEPEEYVVKNFDPNITDKFATALPDLSKYRMPAGGTTASRPTAQPTSQSNFQMSGVDVYGNKTHTEEYAAFDAENMVHLSLNEQMDQNWPFGSSVLEPVFKTFKQKEMLEDSILIYRVQRAPERRIFYIDVGEMNPVSAKAHLEQVKNEIHQRRMPNKTGGGASVMDASYNPLCLDLSTEIPLLDGRTLTLSDLILEYKSGKENWVYSCDPITGEIMPGNITWAGKTRENAKTIKLTFDNGKSLVCTPDHKIPVLGKGFVEAKDIVIGKDSLISHETRMEALSSSSSKRTYEQVYDHHANDWIFTHRMVGNFFRNMTKHQEFTFLPENVGKSKQVIHHKDFNRYNNDPRNLAYMNKEDHFAYHVYNKQLYWKNITSSERTRISSLISEGLKAYYNKMSEEDNMILSQRCSVSTKQRINLQKENDPVGYSEWRTKLGKSRSKYLANNPDALAHWQKSAKSYAENYPNYSFNVTQEILGVLVDAVHAVGSNRKDVIGYLNENSAYAEAVNAANPIKEGVNDKLSRNKITDRQLTNILEHFNYKNWKDFVSKVPVYNHKVVSIETVENRDVGTITVDFQERWHKHHTFAIGAGIFVKNSMLDDYFFAQPMEGRGSRVETLPGGEALGVITDLTYFTKKMARGLSIPTSYLNLGDDEAPSMYNDGKLGQTMIQEFKFTKYCMRLQSLLIEEFDKSFKKFADANGVNIDESTYELAFFPPQNFTKYRQIELDMQQTQVYNSISGEKLLSKRFKLERYLGLTEAEIIRNQEMWAEENAKKFKEATGSTPAEQNNDADLGTMGFSGGDDFGMDSGMGEPDMDMDMDMDADMGDAGGEAPAPEAPPPPEPAA